MMLRIVSPFFVAGLIVGERAAPIISYMKSWSAARVEDYCRKRGWLCEKYP